MLEHVSFNTTGGVAQIAVADNGTLASLSGADVNLPLPITSLNRDGRTGTLGVAPSNWSNITFSPDGRRLALDIFGQQNDIWVCDWSRDALERRTFDAGVQAQALVWTPDGRRIAFGASPDFRFNLFWVRADGSSAPERLTTSANQQTPGSWHPSGRFLAFTEIERRDERRHYDLVAGGRRELGLEARQNHGFRK